MMDCFLIQIRLRPYLIIYSTRWFKRTYEVYIEDGKHDAKATGYRVRNSKCYRCSVIATIVVPVRIHHMGLPLLLKTQNELLFFEDWEDYTYLYLERNDVKQYNQKSIAQELIRLFLALRVRTPLEEHVTVFTIQMYYDINVCKIDVFTIKCLNDKSYYVPFLWCKSPHCHFRNWPSTSCLWLL